VLRQVAVDPGARRRELARRHVERDQARNGLERIRIELQRPLEVRPRREAVALRRREQARKVGDGDRVAERVGQDAQLAFGPLKILLRDERPNERQARLDVLRRAGDSFLREADGGIRAPLAQLEPRQRQFGVGRPRVDLQDLLVGCNRPSCLAERGLNRRKRVVRGG
jgi:hypothetical protein